MSKVDNISDNLPIYFVWFGSDIPNTEKLPYFNNLKNAAKYNQSRDIILVYSKEHLLKDNRKNIDSIEDITVDDIKARVEVVRDNKIKNLWKIDVYDMKLDKQNRSIYDLLDKVFATNFSRGKSYNFCAASDLIRVLLLSITGGIYFDMDTEVTGEIGELNTKFGFVLSNFIFIIGQGFPSASAFTNFIAKSKGPNLYANEIIDNQISACDIAFNEEKKCDLTSGTALAKLVNQKIVDWCSVED